MTLESSTTSSGADSESPEDVQLARTEMKFSWGGWCIHFLQPHACWHPSHGFPDRQVHYRWFSMIAETRLTAQHKNASLLSLDKTLIVIFKLPKCHQNQQHIVYWRLDISVSAT